MVRNNTRTTCFMLATLAALLVAGCGLKGDLYIPGTEAETADARSPDTESPETVNPDTVNADTANPDDEQEQ